jgi:hypothetical protein
MKEALHTYKTISDLGVTINSHPKMAQILRQASYIS